MLDYLSEKKVSIWLESALEIKQSSGLQRVKNDKWCPTGIDAQRIAFYAYRNHDKMKLWEPARQVIKELKTLTALRSRLIKVIKQLKSSLQEGQQFLDKTSQKKIRTADAAAVLPALPECIRSGPC